ncbi:omega-amidase NIT2-like [Leptopilina heterotoma]|uniref:omega-amidase NIT2-like n=1 Tax=Leptopilina heterotoma TaxID=63436 RepID=UPI001CA9398A|nr:omega-amidase NIT2-like [Leptopilina heterotoma]
MDVSCLLVLVRVEYLISSIPPISRKLTYPPPGTRPIEDQQPRAKEQIDLRCQLLIYPGAFSLTTGHLHWTLLQRSRANDNQLYVACVSPARGTSRHIAYGHTQLTDPWGTILRELEEKEDMIIEDNIVTYKVLNRWRITVSRPASPRA